MPRTRFATGLLLTTLLGACAPALQRKPDRDGLCGWTLELAAGEIRELSMAYRVTASRNVRLPF